MEVKCCNFSCYCRVYRAEILILRFLLSCLQAQLEAQWITVACGRTRDQLEMTRAARRFLNNHGWLPLRPRSLNF